MRLELKIVDLMSKNLEKGFTINEIANALEESYSFVNRVVNRLADEKVLTAKKIGMAHLCSLNLESDRTMALLHLNEVNKKDELYIKNREIKLVLDDFLENTRLKFKEDLISIAVFGSYAKGTATKESDIDILIICKKKREMTGITREAYAKYGKEVTPILMTLQEFMEQKEKPIIREIIKYHCILGGFEGFINGAYKK